MIPITYISTNLQGKITFKVINTENGTIYKIFSELIIMTSKSGHSPAFTTNFEKIYLSSLVFSMLHKKRVLFAAKGLFYLG